MANLKSVNLEKSDRPSIVVKGSFLSNQTIFFAFQSLLSGRYTHDVAFQLEKVARRLNELQKTFTNESQLIINKYAELDEKGVPNKKMEPKMLSNGELELAPKKNADGSIEKDANGAPVMEQVMVPVDFLWKEKIVEKNEAGEEVTSSGRELANIEFANLGEKEYTIDVYKFRRADFAEAKLTVAQWMSLNCILQDPYEIEDEVVKANT